MSEIYAQYNSARENACNPRLFVILSTTLAQRSLLQALPASLVSSGRTHCSASTASAAFTLHRTFASSDRPAPNYFPAISTTSRKPSTRQAIAQHRASLVGELALGSSSSKDSKVTNSNAPPALKTAIEPNVRTYYPPITPTERWRSRKTLNSKSQTPNTQEASNPQFELEKTGEIDFKSYHKQFLDPPYQTAFKANRSFDYVKRNRNMKSHVQILTTPTADTPGTSMVLHFDNKRYLIGSLAEGTQRSCIQMGARLLKVSECFISGRTEWSNMGGLVGMILTLADAAASSRAASAEEAKKRALQKAKKLGLQDDPKKIREFEEEEQKEARNSLTLFSPPNLNHLLATARRFVFRKGMPVNVHEIEEGRGKRPDDESEWAPYYADENIKVWAFSVLPSTSGSSKQGANSPRKRSFEEMHDSAANDTLSTKERNQLTTKAVVGEMFNSTWRLDTLYETPLSQVQLPATIFVRDAETNKIKKYTGPMPGNDKEPLEDPNMPVLIRKPWPGALVESLPPTQPAKEAVSYIIRNHTQRGKFHPERAKEHKVEKGPRWALLSAGHNVENVDGETVTPEMVLGESKEGGGMAVADLPDASYIEPLLARPEWQQGEVMAGVGAIVWICGPGVASDPRLHAFMQEHKELQHVVSSPEHCPNQIALDSVAASTIRLAEVDPKRYIVPVHQNEPSQAPATLPEGVHVATRGQLIQLEPTINVHTKLAPPKLHVKYTVSEMAQDILDEAAKARDAVKQDPEITKWADTLPADIRDAEVITLGTGSALPSKYRNVSATLVRVPGWGNMLLDCGENTLGQLKRVYTANELDQILKDLHIIVISHMHADHHLGTVSVIKAWYQAVHDAKPLPTNTDLKTSFTKEGGLAVVSEPAMLHWLGEYASVEDYGFSRLAPLYISPAAPAKNRTSQLGWFVPPSALSSLSQEARNALISANHLPPSFLNLTDLQAVSVQHCHGARAMSITFPSGFKASYSGDCRPSRAFAQIGKGSTVCIHEATFDDELQGDAQAKNHSTTSEALSIAQAMGAKACVLTHFSQRYQKLPVLERAGEDDEFSSALAVEAEDVDMEDGEEEGGAGAPIEDGDGPPRPAKKVEDDVATTFPDQVTTGEGQRVTLPPKNGQPPNADAVKFKLASDMKVGVAFDYMRVKIGEMAELEKFTPALVKLFAEEEATGPEGEVEGGEGGGEKKGDAGGKKGKKDRNGRKVKGQ